jgi:transcriptional regulator with GAF, ATPase, and Fis domain
VTFGRGSGSAEWTEEDGERTLRVLVPDPWMSQEHAMLLFDGRDWVLEDKGSKNGCHVDGLRVDRALLRAGSFFEVGNTVFSFVSDDGDPLDDVDATRQPIAGMETLLPGLERRFADLVRVAQSTTSLLILGETGTGKEVIARAVHRASKRPGEFVAVNCGALPPTLLESELFGHRKGAFSGATEARVGLVRSANSGTLLLDEIGDLPAAAQAALLRVLQEHEVTPVGEHRPVPVDLRVCAATHRDLDDLVKSGQFRRDLLVRLEGYIFRAPSLRERKTDMGLLIRALIERLGGSGEMIRIHPTASRHLLRYSWPGNVRELEKCIESALALAGNDAIRPQHLPEKVRLGPAVASVAQDELLLEQLTSLLKEHQGNVAAVARWLGKHPFQIHRWIKRYQIDLRSFRGRSG